MFRHLYANIFIYCFVTFKKLIPPLPTIGTESTSKYADSIDVLYTNDPSAAVQWYETHVPADKLTIIGFDVEVSAQQPLLRATRKSFHKMF